MNFNPFTRSRTVAVLVGAGALVIAGTTGAVAKSMITSHDLQDGAVTHRVIRDGAVHEKDLSESLMSRLKGQGPAGQQGPEGPRGPKGSEGAQGPAAKYAGPNWSIVDRNVISNGDAYLRSGPSSTAFGSTVAPPMGIGSLGLRTGSGTDKAAFGNQVDFAGQSLSDISTVSYWEFVTGEDLGISATNQPNIQFEVNPHAAGSAYSTLVFVPNALDPVADANKWSQVDASTAKRWYYTGGFGVTSGCNQTTYCTLADAEAKAPDATIYTVQFNKGRDDAFTGAVDALKLGTKVYDFEPLGVTESNANN